MLAWMCAALLLMMSTVAGRVVWAIVVKGTRSRAPLVLFMSVGTVALLGAGVAHFAAMPQSLEVEANGAWTLHNAYGIAVDRVAPDEVRQVRLTTPVGQDFSRVEIRRASGDTLVLHGTNILFSLGYAFNECGSWSSRPLWGPHAFGPMGPQCDDEPWPAPMRHSVPVRSLAAR